MKRLELTARASPMTKSLLKATGGVTFTTHWTAVGASMLAVITVAARVERGSDTASVRGRGGGQS